MPKHLQNFCGFKQKSPSQDPDRPGSAKAETPRTTKKLHEMLDWQTINSHFDKCAKASGAARGVKEPGLPTSAVHGAKECSMDMFESTQSGKSELSLSSSSTRQLELEILVRKFLDAHAELGRRALGAREVIHQLGNADDDFQRELQIYELLVKDSTTRFSALSQKLSRLQTKIELSSSLRSGKHRSDSSCTQRQSLLQAKAPEHAPSHGYFARRATSAQHGARINMPDAITARRSGTAPQPVQRGSNSQTRHAHEPQSHVSAAGGESAKVKARSEAQPRTLGDLPRVTPEELLSLDQQSLQVSAVGGEPAKVTARCEAQPRTLGDLPMMTPEDNLSLDQPSLQFCVASSESANIKAQSEAQPRTLGDLPKVTPEDLLRLNQPSTLPDLPNIVSDDSSIEDA